MAGIANFEKSDYLEKRFNKKAVSEARNKNDLENSLENNLQKSLDLEILILKQKQIIFQKLTGYPHPFVLEIDGLCGSGKTTQYEIFKNASFSCTDDHNADKTESNKAFAQKIKLKKEKDQLIEQQKKRFLTQQELERLENLPEEINKAGDFGALKLELLKWRNLYNQEIEKAKKAKENGTKYYPSLVVSTRGIFTLLAYGFTRKARGEVSYLKDIATKMIDLFEEKIIPIPYFFGFIETGNLDVNQARLLTRLNPELRANDLIEISSLTKIIDNTGLYNKFDQKIHENLLLELKKRYIEEGITPIIQNSVQQNPNNLNIRILLQTMKNITSNRIILPTSLEQTNISKSQQIFLSFLKDIRDGNWDGSNTDNLQNLKQANLREGGEKISLQEYFQKLHSNDYGFNYETFSQSILLPNTNQNHQKYQLDLIARGGRSLKEYEIFCNEIMKGLDIIIPTFQPNTEILKKTITGILEHWKKLSKYLPNLFMLLNAKLKIIIVQQTNQEISTELVELINSFKQSHNQSKHRFYNNPSQQKPKIRF